MKGTVFFSFSLFVAFAMTALPAVAQDRATMTSPIIRTTMEEVILVANFQGFAPDGQYRVGVGAANQNLDKVKVELLKEDTPFAKGVVNFDQGHAIHWWKVKQISLTGFVLSPEDLPAANGTLTLRAIIPKAEADRLGKLYLLVSKLYGPDTWYIEDGAELHKGHW